jgi:hypothetical protein
MSFYAHLMKTASCALALMLASTFAVPAMAKDEVRRDPKGQTGISPYNEDLAKGRDAFKGGDHGAAIGHFDAAIQKDGQKMMAYLMKAQSQLAKGDLDLALATAETGRAKEGTEDQQAKMLFLFADLTERKADTAPGADAQGGLKDALQGKWEQVKVAWNGYIAYVAAHTRVPDYKASAEDRNKKIDERVKRDKDYGEVRARIVKNEKDADDAMAKDAAKN